jgi:hypothetical protein
MRRAPTSCTSVLAADFAAEHGVVCDIETIPIDYCNEAMVGCPAGSCTHASLLRIPLLPCQGAVAPACGGSGVHLAPPHRCPLLQERMHKNDVRYRFVIDIQGSLVA